MMTPAHPANTEPCRHHGFPHLSLSWRSALLHRPQQEDAAHLAWKNFGKIRPAQPAIPHTGNMDGSGVRGSLLSLLQMSAPVLTSIFCHLFYCLLSEVGKTISISNLFISHGIFSLTKSCLTVKLVKYPP